MNGTRYCSSMMTLVLASSVALAQEGDKYGDNGLPEGLSDDGGIMKIMKAAFATILLASPAIVSARDVPPIYVVGNADDPALISCGLSTAPLVTEAEAVLGGKGVQIASLDQVKAKRALVLTVDLHAVSLANITCAGNLTIRLVIGGVVPNPVSGEDQAATLEYCTNGAVYSGASVQSDLTNMIRPWTEECLAEYTSE